MDIVYAIKKEAKAQGVKIGQIAEKLGMSQPSLSQMLESKSIKFSMVQKIADILNVSIDHLLGKHGDTQLFNGDVKVSNGVVGYMSGGCYTVHSDESKDEVIKNKDEQVKNIFSILRSELSKFYEKMDKKDVYIEKLIAENSMKSENNVNQMMNFLQAAERKHEGSMNRVEENAKRIDELIKIIISQDDKTQERADKLVNILERKL